MYVCCVVVATYGSSVGSLFNFARWLFFLNVVLFLLWLFLVIIPQSISFDYGTVNASFSILDLIAFTVRQRHCDFDLELKVTAFSCVYK